jgi:hypothetical protein
MKFKKTLFFLTTILILILIVSLSRFDVYASTVFSAVNITSVHTCPLDTHTFVIAYSDEDNDDVSFQIYDANGTQVLAETDVDTTVGSTSYTAVGVSALSSTNFVIGWIDKGSTSVTFAIYDRTGALLSGPTNASTDIGTFSSISVSAFNSSHFVVGWFDQVASDITFSIYDSSSSLIAGPTDADDSAGTSNSVVVSAFNSTYFVIGWFDRAEYDHTFSVYTSSGTLITGPIDAGDYAAGPSYATSVATFNSTYFVIGWFDRSAFPYNITFSVYDSSGVLKTGPKIVDDTGSGGDTVQLAALNSTTFVISWYDPADFDLTYAVYDTAGTSLVSPTDIESWPTASNTPFKYQNPCSQESATSIELYSDNWIIAYANTTTEAIWKAFKPDGTSWDGTVLNPPTIGSPTVTWDDTDNCYAQKKTYDIQVVYTDLDTFPNIAFCELFLKTGANMTRAEFAFDEDTNTFSTVSGSTEWTMTGANTSAGNTITITWTLTAQWDATEESDLDLFFFANDTASSFGNSLYDANFDVVTRLVTSGLASDDSRINIAGTTTISGTVYYANDPASNTASTSYPPDAEFTSVSIHDSAHAVGGTDVTIVNGAFSASFAIPNAVQSNTYHVYLNMADADYTDADAPDGDTTAVIGDRIRIDSLATTDTRANVGDTITIYATASLEYDGHALGVGDALTLTGHVFTWDVGDGRFEHDETILVVGDHTINSFTSGTEAGFTITEGNINAQTETTIWDALMIFNVQAVQYKGSGGFYYQAQIEWVWDSVVIDGATCGVAYPNDTAIGSMTSNSTGWLVFVINQGNATNGDFIIYGIDDNLWDITVAGSNKTFTLWNWALATKDIDGNALSNTNITVTKAPTTVWTGSPCTLYVPADTFAISITWLQNLPVNTTAAVIIGGATSTNFNCTVYLLTGTSYHFATNTTISSNSYASEILSLSFSGATSTYTFVIDKPQKPTYIINATYDYATAYTTYLALPHYGNQSLQVSYEWGTDLYVQKTTHKFLSVTMVGQLMSITATGTVGDIATLEVYCGTRGNPATVTGWVGTSWSPTLSVLTGTLTFASDTTVTLTWVSGGSAPGGTQPPAISPLIATVIVSFPLKNTQGTVINANVSITWTGVTVVTVNEIFIDSPDYATWQLLVPDGLPQQLTITGTMGQATIPITLQIPADAEPGTYIVPCIVSFGWESGAGTKTFRTVSNLDVIVPPPTVPDLMTYWWLIMFGGLVVGMLVLRGTRKH